MEASQTFSNEMRKVVPKGVWLEKANYKADLLRKSFLLKKQISRETYVKYLEIYEARDNYLNQLPIKDLKNLIKDLEKVVPGVSKDVS